jgi:hypothetical protein
MSLSQKANTVWSSNGRYINTAHRMLLTRIRDLESHDDDGEVFGHLFGAWVQVCRNAEWGAVFLRK